MRRKLEQQNPIKACNLQSYDAVTRILSLTAFDLGFQLDKISRTNVLYRRKERRICRRDRAREREREKRDAKEVQQRPPTSPVSENRLPFPPTPPPPPPPPKKKSLPRKLPLNPHKGGKKKKKKTSKYLHK
jgi:hypothetical protein